MPKKRWEDLSGAQKGAIVLSGVVQLGLLVAAFINYVGPISYFLFGRKL